MFTNLKQQKQISLWFLRNSNWNPRPYWILSLSPLSQNTSPPLVPPVPLSLKVMFLNDLLACRYGGGYFDFWWMTNPRFFCLLRWRWPGAIRRQEMNSWFGVFRRASSLESGHSKGMWKPTQMCMVHLISNNFWNWKSPILERHFFKKCFFFRLLTQNSTWNVFKCVIYPTVIDNCTKTSYYRLAG